MKSLRTLPRRIRGRISFGGQEDDLVDEDFLQEQIDALQLGDAWEKVIP